MVVSGRGNEPLTRREVEVLALLATHLSQPQIARRIFVSDNTVKSHVKAIYRKLGVASRTDAVARAGELRLVDGAA